MTVNSWGQALIKPFVIYKHLCWDSIQVLTNHPYFLSIFYLVSCPDFPLGSCTLNIRSESSDQIFTPLVLHLSDWWLCIDNPCQNSPNKQILYVGQAKARSWTILLDNSHCRDAARYGREIVTISRWDVFLLTKLFAKDVYT